MTDAEEYFDDRDVRIKQEIARMLPVGSLICHDARHENMSDGPWWFLVMGVDLESLSWDWFTVKVVSFQTQQTAIELRVWTTHYITDTGGPLVERIGFPECDTQIYLPE